MTVDMVVKRTFDFSDILANIPGSASLNQTFWATDTKVAYVYTNDGWAIDNRVIGSDYDASGFAGDASSIQGVTVDDSAKADGKVLKYIASSGNLEYAADNEGAGGSDSAAIHGNASGEISLITPKTTPVDNDIDLIEDSAASFVKKKVTWANRKATLKTYFDTLYAAIAGGVTNGDSHDHSGGDGAQIDHGSLGGLSDDDHTIYVKHSLATAVSDFLVSSGAGVWVKKTLAEVKTILGLGTAAYTASTDYAVTAKGVTNGDSHDHAGGDGGQVDHGGLGGLADDDHTQYVKHALATAANDFLVASGSGVIVKKTLAETQAILDGAVTMLALPTATATPSLAGGTHFSVTNLAAQNITNFPDGVVGQTYHLFFANGNTTLIFYESTNLFRSDGIADSDSDITFGAQDYAYVTITLDGTKTVGWGVR